MSLTNALQTVFPELVPSQLLPTSLFPRITYGEATIESSVWILPSLIRRIRLCKLEVLGKFQAETLVIYPEFMYDVPIFGTEYLNIGGKRYFGGIDFHPLSQEKDYIDRYINSYLGDFPDKSVENSKFYNLNKYFSSKFWLKKQEENFYEEFILWVEKYMRRYRICLEEATPVKEFSINEHIAYDTHMAEKDPAHGILKAYFSKDFADLYINQFLFDLSK